ncbi:hypothetical protein CPL00136_CDS0097 [Salmonella phage vB_SenS-3]|uniref:Uncharacterized protein n=1 Tax=Salmonella phage PMBT36 TaxID=3229746 RepID=A0AB39C1M9_9CAUD
MLEFVTLQPIRESSHWNIKCQNPNIQYTYILLVLA